MPTKWGGIVTGYYNGKLNFSIIEEEDLGQSTSIWEANVSKCSAKKLSALKDINDGAVYKKNIYYTNVDWDRDVTAIEKCDLSGKNVKTIKKGENINVIHLGKKLLITQSAIRRK